MSNRRNLLTKRRVNGTGLFEESEIKNGVCRAFHPLRREALLALSSLSADKAVRMDGFTMAF